MKLYSDLNLIKFGYPVELLIPFIGLYNKEDEKGSVMYGRFDEYMAKGREIISFTSNVEEADACLLPVYWNALDESKNRQPDIQAFLKEAEASGKKILVFAGHDVPMSSIPVKNAVVFNSAVSRSSRAANIFPWPHFFEDFVESYTNGDAQPKAKPALPVIGFCGYAPPLNMKMGKEKLIGLMKLIANYAGYIQRHPAKASHSYRARAIIGLKRSGKVKLNLRLKSNFAFGPQGQLNTGNTNETHNAFRQNFVNNILESDYTLCVRGIGNNSVRFFETLCCGRIPVFVDTDSVLPFDHIINWKELCVWVKEKDIDRIGDVVSEFHHRISEKEFIELQQKLRSIWKEYLSPIGFFKHLHLFLQ